MQQQEHDDRPLDMNEMRLQRLLVAQAAEAVGQPHAHHQPQPAHDQLSPPASLSPHQHRVDPAIASSTYAMTAMDEDEDPDSTLNGKRPKPRELSSSKRAEQNRTAQRAFRQRKESYIKKLEEQVRTYSVTEASYKHLQVENYELRGYILQLQALVLECQGSYPPPPPTFSMDVHRNSAAQSSPQTSNQHEPPAQHQRIIAPIASMISAEPPPRQQQPPSHQKQQQQVQQQPTQQQQHNHVSIHEPREAQMEKSAVDQLKEAAAAAEAPESTEERDIKYAIEPHDKEQAYAIEAAKAAATYAASKPVGDMPEGKDNRRSTTPTRERFLG